MLDTDLQHHGSTGPRLILNPMTGRPKAGRGPWRCCLPGNPFDLALKRVPIMGTVWPTALLPETSCPRWFVLPQYRMRSDVAMLPNTAGKHWDVSSWIMAQTLKCGCVLEPLRSVSPSMSEVFSLSFFFSEVQKHSSTKIYCTGRRWQDTEPEPSHLPN